MEKRRLGRTGLTVSEIGFGAWGIGQSLWVGADDAESLRALHRAADLGVNLVDTAFAYGSGHSEALVGRLVRERREPVHVATKIPPLNLQWPATTAMPLSACYTADHLVACTERSLQELGLERVDVMQLHTWSDHWLDDADHGWRAAMDRLQREGKVGWWGVSVTEHAPDSGLSAVASGLFDVAQVIYNIFDPSAAERFLPACARHDVGVLARVPFDEGGLTGTLTPETEFPEGDFRRAYFRGDRRREVAQRVERLRAVMGAEARTIPELALRFCLSHPAVTSVIPGMRRVASVDANAAVSDGRALSAGLQQVLRSHAWLRNFWNE